MKEYIKPECEQIDFTAENVMNTGNISGDDDGNA